MFHVKHLIVFLLVMPGFSYSQNIGTTVLKDVDLPRFEQSDTRIHNFLHEQTTYSSLSELSKEWFYWTNYSRISPKRFYDSIVVPLTKVLPSLKTSNFKSLKRDLYASPVLPLLTPNTALMEQANLFVSEMASKNAKLSHNTPSGSTFESRMAAAKIKSCAGENISSGKLNTVLMLVLLYIDEGVADLGHRKSLLNPSFTEMGIGYAVYPNGNYIIAQDFACPQNE